MKSKRGTLSRAWMEHAPVNLRGHIVRWGSAEWVVITHIRGGVWKLTRLSGSWDHGDTTKLKLDRNGRVVR